MVLRNMSIHSLFLNALTETSLQRCNLTIEPIENSFSIGHDFVPLRNEPVFYEIINKNCFQKRFQSIIDGTGMVTPDSCCLYSCFFPL